MAKLITPPFRLSFVDSIFTGEVVKDKDGNPVDPPKRRYPLCAIWIPARFINREKAQWKEIMEALDTVSLAEFKKKWADLPQNIKRGIRDGAEREGTAGFGPGTKFATLATTRLATQSRSEIIDIRGDPIGPEYGNTALVYPGAWARASVRPYPYNVNQGRGVALGWQNLQILDSTTPRLDGGSSAKDDFGDSDVEITHLMEQDETAVEE